MIRPWDVLTLRDIGEVVYLETDGRYYLARRDDGGVLIAAMNYAGTIRLCAPGLPPKEIDNRRGMGVRESIEAWAVEQGIISGGAGIL